VLVGILSSTVHYLDFGTLVPLVQLLELRSQVKADAWGALVVLGVTMALLALKRYELLDVVVGSLMLTGYEVLDMMMALLVRRSLK